MIIKPIIDAAGLFRPTHCTNISVTFADPTAARFWRLPMQPATSLPRHPQTDVKGVNILARSLFRQMREQGYTSEQIIGLSSELIELVRGDLERIAAAQ